jgi:hypothetical protein
MGSLIAAILHRLPAAATPGGRVAIHVLVLVLYTALLVVIATPWD